MHILQTVILVCFALPCSGSTCAGEDEVASVPCRLFPCLHGACVNLTLPTRGLPLVVEACECREGWFGRDCSICCPLACKNGGTCMVNLITHEPQCDCPPEYPVMPLCDATTTTTTAAAAPDVSVKDISTACLSKKRTDSSDEPCTINKRCVNGDCVDARPRWFGGGERRCQCDLGWTGETCDLCCDLDCTESSVCAYNNTGHKVCAKGATGASKAAIISFLFPLFCLYDIIF